MEKGQLGITLEDGGVRWNTEDNDKRYGIMTLVLKICKNLLDARRLEHLFAPRPLPAEHTFDSACGKLVDNFPAPVDNFLKCGKLVENFNEPVDNFGLR